MAQPLLFWPEPHLKGFGRNLECYPERPALSDSRVRRFHLQPSSLARATEGHPRSERRKPDPRTDEEEAQCSERERGDANSSSERWLLSAAARHDLTDMHSFSIDQLISTSWERRLADDLATELELYTGEKRQTVEEMRRFLAIKGYREQFRRLQEAREGRKAHEALRAAAHAMRSCALERPALAAAAFRTPPSDGCEWKIYAQSRELLLGILEECGLRGPAADQAIHILRSLVRGFVLHEFMNTFLHIFSYERVPLNTRQGFLSPGFRPWRHTAKPPLAPRKVMLDPANNAQIATSAFCPFATSDEVCYCAATDGQADIRRAGTQARRFMSTQRSFGAKKRPLPEFEIAP